MAGENDEPNYTWSLSTEVRFIRVGSLILGSVRDLEYNLLTFQLGLRYRF
ncbi:MAG: hypothetical protein WBD34_17645 [Burkholderiaceae bacterium]